MSSALRPSLIWTWKITEACDRADIAILAALEQLQGTVQRDFQGSLENAEVKDIPTLSRSQLRRLMDEERVTHAGRIVKANSKLQPGMQISVHFPPPMPTELIPEDRPIEVIYEDQHLIVVNKPPGLTVHPSNTQMEGTLVHALLHHIKDLSGIGGVLRPGIVHRIDKNTSGALLITKTDQAHQKMAEIFAKHDIERTYWALCYGAPQNATQKAVKIESLIGRSDLDRKKMSMKVTEGRKAVTWYQRKLEYTIPNKRPFASWIEVTLETGRTHQVRVHLTGIGHSILGDPMYGTVNDNQAKWQTLPKNVQAAVEALPGQALHARVLGFQHPITGEKLRFEATPPAEFQALVGVLKEYSV